LEEEDLERLAREGKLEGQLRELKRLYAMWREMDNKHRKIYDELVVSNPEKKEKVEEILKMLNELTNRFETDISQIEEYLLKKG